MPQITGLLTGSELEFQQSIDLNLYNCTSVDAGPNNAGITLTSGVIYQITSANSWVTTAPSNSQMQLPLTSGPNSLRGVQLYIINTGANPIALFPHPGDTGNSINGQASNTSVVLGPNTITEFTCLTPGIWFADGIGAGFAGSIETVISQGTIAAAGSTQATATPITQAMVLVTTSAASQGVALPPAKAGLQIVVQPPITSTGTPLLVYPVNGGSDAINALSANTAFSIAVPVTSFTVFACFNNGLWFTK